MFKLHLLESSKEDEKPFLPDGLDYRNVITDYLKQLGDHIKEDLYRHWKVDFYKNVLIVLTVRNNFFKFYV